MRQVLPWQKRGGRFGKSDIFLQCFLDCPLCGSSISGRNPVSQDKEKTISVPDPAVYLLSDGTDRAALYCVRRASDRPDQSRGSKPHQLPGIKDRDFCSDPSAGSAASVLDHRAEMEKHLWAFHSAHAWDLYLSGVPAPDGSGSLAVLFRPAVLPAGVLRLVRNLPVSGTGA